MLPRRSRRRSGSRRLGSRQKVQVVANATGILQYGAWRLEGEFLIYKLPNKLSFREDCPQLIISRPPHAYSCRAALTAYPSPANEPTLGISCHTPHPHSEPRSRWAVVGRHY